MASGARDRTASDDRTATVSSRVTFSHSRPRFRWPGTPVFESARRGTARARRRGGMRRASKATLHARPALARSNRKTRARHPRMTSAASPSRAPRTRRGSRARADEVRARSRSTDQRRTPRRHARRTRADERADPFELLDADDANGASTTASTTTSSRWPRRARRRRRRSRRGLLAFPPDANGRFTAGARRAAGRLRRAVPHSQTRRADRAAARAASGRIPARKGTARSVRRPPTVGAGVRGRRRTPRRGSRPGGRRSARRRARRLDRTKIRAAFGFARSRRGRSTSSDVVDEDLDAARRFGRRQGRRSSRRARVAPTRREQRAGDESPRR